MKTLTCGGVVFVIDKIAAIQFDENFAGETNIILVYLTGIAEPVRVKVDDGEQAFRDFQRELAKE